MTRWVVEIVDRRKYIFNTETPEDAEKKAEAYCDIRSYLKVDECEGPVTSTYTCTGSIVELKRRTDRSIGPDITEGGTR